MLPRLRSPATALRVAVPSFVASLACVLALAAVALEGCSRQALPPPASAGQVSALERTDVRAGSGAEAVSGARVAVHYTGWLYDRARPDQKGTQFDSSRGGQPFQFVLGTGQVIPGWDQGVLGMKVGGQRRLVIPAALAYGDSGAGGVIPPGATLVFDVELVDVAAPTG